MLELGADGRSRCRWGTSSAEYITYHDTEWGVGTTDDTRLFEKLCLEGFQAGLSWLTILRKREHFRAAFAWPHATFGAPSAEIPATTDTSTMLSKDLKRRGWSFLGPTTMYAFMQAMGLVNDHVEGCWVRERTERSRRKAARSVGHPPRS